MKCRSVAILWDWQNVRASHEAQLDAVLKFAQTLGGAIAYKLVYAHWRAEKPCWERHFDKLDFECVNAIASKEKPNNADLKLMHSCQRHILHEADVKTVILISGDGDFKGLVKQLKAKGKKVVVISHCLTQANRGLVRLADFAYELGKI